jgi:hypothetical protein
MSVGWAVVVIVQWVAIVALTVVVLGILRQVTPHIEKYAEASAAGALPGRRVAFGRNRGGALPEFSAHDGDGQAVTAASLLGHSRVLLFLSGTCEPCHALAREIRESTAGDLSRSLIVVTDPGSPDSLNLPSWARVITMPSSAARSAFDFPGWPFAMAVDESGAIKGATMLNTLAQVVNLAAAISPDPRLKVSSPMAG